MFFLRILRDPGDGPDLVQISDETFRRLYEFEGRAAAVSWLVRQGCCPGASATLHDCDYGQAYNINSPTKATGARGPVRR